MSVELKIDLPVQVLDALEEYAEECGLSLEEVLVNAIREHVDGGE